MMSKILWFLGISMGCLSIAACEGHGEIRIPITDDMTTSNTGDTGSDGVDDGETTSDSEDEREYPSEIQGEEETDSDVERETGSGPDPTLEVETDSDEVGGDGSDSVSDNSSETEGATGSTDTALDSDSSNTDVVEEDFSVILLPDTQNYTKNMADNAQNTYYKQAQWIIDHQEEYNIKFVVHLGDITNDNTVEQWTIADKAHTMLDKAGVPYSILPGNHDYRTDDGISRGATLLNDYFPPSRFSGRPWYGGAMGKSSENNYAFFEVGSLKFMVLSLEYAPRRHTLCWADDVIAAHPDHRVIIATHCYLTVNGKYCTSCPDDDYNFLGADGETIFKALASRHSNVFMVVSGHVGESAYTLTTGNNGNDVHQMVVDYQFEVPCSAADPTSCTDRCHTGDSTGNGWLRRLIFSPLDNTIQSETVTVEAGNEAIFPQGEPTLFCSPYNTNDYNRYASDPNASDHVFTISYDMSGAFPYAYDDLGSEAFQDQTVNSKGTGQQLRPDIAINADGAFVIAWEDDSSDSDGEGNFDIHVRGFEPGGCQRFADVVVNVDTANQQKAPAVAMDQTGNFVVVWQDDRDGNDVYQIYARGFNPDGTERFPTKTVNSVADRQQLAPDIAMTPDGSFVVVWENNTEAAPNYQVFARSFYADGKPRFDDISVNTTTSGEHLSPAVAMDREGGFIVVWQDDTDDNGYYQIHGRGFDADGGERLARFTVNTDDTGQQLNPSIGMDETGGFAVAFEDDIEKDGIYRILVRGFDADGRERFADTRISDADPGQRYPSLDMMPNGNLVATWQDDRDGNEFYQVYSRGLMADGTEWFERFTVHRDDSGQQIHPMVAVSPAGTAVFTWEDDMDDNGYYQIHARSIDGV